LPLQAVEPRRLYRQIADQIAQLIASGEFPPGARLYDTQPSDWNELKVLWQQATSTRQSPDAA